MAFCGDGDGDKTKEACTQSLGTNQRASSLHNPTQGHHHRHTIQLLDIPFNPRVNNPKLPSLQPILLGIPPLALGGYATLASFTKLNREQPPQVSTSITSFNNTFITALGPTKVGSLLSVL
jgi:hypothetical protein